ncbi:hypothetical protein MMC20_004830 [Loxospora ochrophaea]|nr:hypothetical protein [Loxospora ochrophaea]
MQETLSKETPEKVPGDNPAFYCGPARKDQLLDILEFDTSPNPPTANKRYFFYLLGEAPDDERLHEAQLKLTVIRDFVANDNPWIIDIPFAKTPHVIVRKTEKQDERYQKELQAGRIEIIADGWFPKTFIQTGNWTFLVELTLPDGRVLSCFKATVYLEGDA